MHFAEDRVASKLVELSLIDSKGRIRESDFNTKAGEQGLIESPRLPMRHAADN